MFEALSQKFQGVLSFFSGKKNLTEENIAEGVGQVRLALLDADVHFDVVEGFVKSLIEKAKGAALIKSVTPGQQFIHLVHEELIKLMGTEEAPLDLKGKLSVLMVCGLQGSGKTTSCAKLAQYIRKTEKHKKILLAACDLARPAAVDQLTQLGESLSIPVFSIPGEKSPIAVVRGALQKAKESGIDVLILDTAGRLHLDAALMQELVEIHSLAHPRETLFVASAAMGQDAARSAAEFGKKLPITGTILTMLDAGARAGAALSIREVTGKPLKFEGVGEKPSDFQLFNPRSMADRILGMGDVINFVKKAEEQFDKGEQAAIEQKLKKSTFTYQDYLSHMQKVKKMGSMKSLLKMIPGLSASLDEFEASDAEFGKAEAMIYSMTPRERLEKDELTISRRKRIALGSGVTLDDVNKMAKGFQRAKQLFKNMSQLNMGGMDLSKLKKMEGKRWR